VTKFRVLGWLLGLSWGLSACAPSLTLSPIPSDVKLPETWSQAPKPQAAEAASEASINWWKSFKDPQLDALMESALQRNRDLVRNALRLQQAVLKSGQAELDRGPRPSASLSSSLQGPLTSSQGSTSTQVNGLTVPVGNNMGVTKSLGLSSSLSQEIDLWGRLAQSAAVAYQNQAIAQADLDAARWLLTAKVAEQYWTLAATDAKMVLAKQATKDAQINLEVIQLRLANGKIRPAEVDRSTLALEQAQQKEVALALQRSNTVQTLALLLDDAPQNLSVPQPRLPSSLPTEPQAWPAAAVVDRLPAVRRSRLALDVAARNLNIAESNRYPQFSLSATASASGDSLSNVLSNPLGSLGLNLSLPMVDWKRLRINRDVSQVDLDIAAVDFRETLYKALSEVDQQYNQRRQWVADSQSLQLKSAQAEQALAVAQLRYEVGAEPLQTVRDAQANLRDLESNRIELRMKAWNNQINIFKAWGGPLGGPVIVTPTSAASVSP